MIDVKRCGDIVPKFGGRSVMGGIEGCTDVYWLANGTLTAAR